MSSFFFTTFPYLNGFVVSLCFLLNVFILRSRLGAEAEVKEIAALDLILVRAAVQKPDEPFETNMLTAHEPQMKAFIESARVFEESPNLRCIMPRSSLGMMCYNKCTRLNTSGLRNLNRIADIV